MQYKPANFRTILFFAAVISTFENLLWIAVSLAAILTFRCALRTPQYNTDYFLPTTLVKFYFEGDDCKVEGQPDGYPGLDHVSMTRPVEVFSWMVSNLIVSLMFFFISVSLLYKRKACGDRPRQLLLFWCFMAFVSLIMDAVLTAIFVRDCFRLKEFLKDNPDESNIISIPTAMFVIAARGFALWIIRLILLIYFIRWLTYTPKMLHGSTSEKESPRHYATFDNYNFNTSLESLMQEKRKSYEAKENYRDHRRDQLRRLSVGSLEGVTHFNTEEPSSRESTRNAELLQSNKDICNCNLYAQHTKIPGHESSPGGTYHSHGCNALMSELEDKLRTIRAKRKGETNPKTLMDFSHDIRNFKRGGDQSKAEPSESKINKLPHLPRAMNLKQSSFY